MSNCCMPLGSSSATSLSPRPTLSLPAKALATSLRWSNSSMRAKCSSSTSASSTFFFLMVSDSPTFPFPLSLSFNPSFLEGHLALISFLILLFRIGPGFKYAYIPWCGGNVTGLLKGSFNNHGVEFGNFLKVLSPLSPFVLPRVLRSDSSSLVHGRCCPRSGERAR